jgi:hypothetical protein
MKQANKTNPNKKIQLDAFKAGMEYAALHILGNVPKNAPHIHIIADKQTKIMCKAYHMKRLPSNFTSYHNEQA